MHFTVSHNATTVSTSIDADAYWQDPLPHAGDGPGIEDFGVTNRDFSDQERSERPSGTDVFLPGEAVWFWVEAHAVPNDPARTKMRF